MMNSKRDSKSQGGRIADLIMRADAYFLSDALRNEGASEVANTRMGVLFCISASLGTLIFMPIQFSVWPIEIGLAATLLATATLILPFALRQTRAIRSLGQVACGILALGTTISVWMSAGQAGGGLPFLPILPMAGLLVRGGRGALLWAGVALAISALGVALLASEAAPTPGSPGSPELSRDGLAILCIGGLGARAPLFEVFWNRTAIEVANRAQAELRAREERNRSLLEYATEGVMVVDADTIVKFASPAAERLLGIGPGEAIGQLLRNFSDPEDLHETYRVWFEVTSRPDGVGRFQSRTRGGLGPGDPAKARVLDITVSNRLDNPSVTGVIVRLRDITDLSQAEANYQSLVENSLQGILVICDDAIVYANDALAELFGVSRQELLRNGDVGALDHVHRDDRQRVHDCFTSNDPTGSCSTELRVLRGDGAWCWIQMRWADMSWEGRPARQIAHADISAQKELTAQQEREHERLGAAILERTRELEASQQSLREQERMAAVGTLAAGIAHQINNPIGAILTSADFAIMTAHEDGGAQIRTDALHDIRAQAIRCGKIVRSVLQFSRSEATEKWSSDLTSVLRTAVDVTAHYATERAASIQVSLSPEASDRTTLMNPIELEQVFVNLIRNAIESQPTGGNVSVSTRMVDEEIEVVIEDDGPGIAEIHAIHVFEPFYTTRLRDGGTGLGLSVAHGIVVDHGGSMWHENSEEAPEAGPRTPRGARFHVRLPSEKAKILA